MSVPEAVAASRRPRPLLSQRAEQQLGARHREVLDQLESLFLREGFSGFSVRELAAHVGCSRRTLYELAPSKDELVLIVFDRFLHRVGRAALESIDGDRPFADQIRAYFLGGIELQRIGQVFGEDLTDEPAARRLFDRHYGYVMAVVEQLVRGGIAAGEFRPVTPAVVAGVLAGSAQFFNQPDVQTDHGLDLERAVDELLDLVVRAVEV
ncbi:MAG: TetR/AcrR family transcriptional regulator [Ilumatobacter sp.]|uniref:TetR/AcrR family transcriptional regulator n=1 Tax=Ilumatobacter sp. TaxID=1967498 RepID=UPI002634020B|nr:TetR/AcrR family transcriptional regulator [Ilumatobacter sp.]MDJ0771703.1 TetR/AcrR family transcriptional regulator [Ilumatobacter sp.]